MQKGISRVEYGDPNLAYLFEMPTSKVNVMLTEEDNRNKVRVYCNEAYAAELFAMYMKRNPGPVTSKDIAVGDSISVKAVEYVANMKQVMCEDLSTGILVIVPLSEFHYDVEDMKTAELRFETVVTKNDKGIYATCRNPKQYRAEINEAYAENKWFDVKIVSLIRGGYKALYKNTVECFIPGSHAAANVIEDFNSYIGKTLPVMVDNYDGSSGMYVVSYKKYIKFSLPTMVHNLEFGRKYSGRLTSNPTEFGLFVEFDNYYTGLIHKVDIDDYENAGKKYRAGEPIDVYVKNVTEKKGNVRIVLTLDEKNIDREKLMWYTFRKTCEGKTLEYSYDHASGKFSVITPEGEHVNIALPPDFDASVLEQYKKISICAINVLRQDIRFDFTN